MEDIRERRLYKRLLEFGSDDTSVWQDISRIRQGPLGLEVLEECRTDFEKALVALNDLPPAIRARVQENAAGRPLVLIDFPWRHCEPHPCDVVVCRKGPKDEDTTEASDLLRLLYDDEFFSKRVSCLRVFVNPRIRTDLMPYKEQIASLLGKIVRAKWED